MNERKYKQMCNESEQFVSNYTQSQEILNDRYQQEINKVVSNIKYEVEKADSPNLGETLSEPLTTIDLTTGDN